MFVWEFWKEVVESSMEMAAKTALTSSSIHQGAEASPDAYRPVSYRNDPVFAEYQLFQQLAQLTACFVDERGHAREFSSNWQDHVGLSPYQCYLEHFDHFFHPQHRQLFHGKIMELACLCEEEDNYDLSIRFRAQYGSTHSGYKWNEFTMTPHVIDEESGKMIFAVLMRDITTDVATERALRTAKIEAELAMKARAEFLGHMSHELRTPLNAILGFAEMMEYGVYGSIEHQQYHEYLTNIRESGNLLLNRINDMLEIASIEVGDAKLQESRVELETLMETSKKLHRHEAFCRKVTIRVPREYPKALLLCDSAKLSRAMGNIIANAIRFSEPGQVVDCRCDVDAKNKLTLTIQDNGQGMSEEQLATIHSMLKKPQCMFSGSPDKMGLGLGLAVAHEFVTLHQGKMKIESAKGEGTTVTIAIPAERMTSLETPTSKTRRRRMAAVA